MGGDSDLTRRTTPKNGVLGQVIDFIKYMMKSDRTRLERAAGFLTLLVVLSLVIAAGIAIVLIPKGVTTWLWVTGLAGLSGATMVLKHMISRRT
jgi:hypothetical protein